MRRLRASALLVVLTVLTVACGARLSDQERRMIISGDGQRPVATTPGGTAAPGAGGPTSAPTPATAAGPTAGTTGGGGSTGGAGVAAPDGSGSGGGSGSDGSSGTSGTGGADQATSGRSGGSSGASGPGGADGSGGSGSGGSDGSGSAAPSGNTQAAPPGGNGGATDVGVTSDRIVISNISDITGAVPGLFEAIQKAVTAYITKFTATEGTVYGRRIELINRDSKMDAQENRRLYLAACEDSFATVGSMSAFAYGAAQPIGECGIPDLRPNVVAKALMNTSNVFAAGPQNAGSFAVTSFQYYKQQAPEAVANAGAAFVNTQLTAYQTDRVVQSTKRIGYRWHTRIPVSISETNYAPIVTEFKNAGIEFVYFLGAYQQSVRLAEAMQQQNYDPAVFAMQAQNYTRDLLVSGGGAVEGIYMGVPSVLLNQQNAELAEYRRWLKQVDPNAQPTALGMYAWASAKLFVRGLKQIGPRPTRQKLLEFYRGVRGYEAGGLIPPQDVGAKRPGSCYQIVQIRGGSFQKVAPQGGGYRCGRVVSTG